jgi:uncharacterized peroxidase-related enzyme
MMFRPETAKPLSELAEVLLRGPSSLSRGERELIAAYVSKENDCQFCQMSHGTFAQLQLDDGAQVVAAVKADYTSAAISDKLKALLNIAGKVRVGGKQVSAEDVAAAREQGATDIEIHDTVLIAAAFCMFNRYVDGLATFAPSEPEDYLESGQMIVDLGYVAVLPG